MADHVKSRNPNDPRYKGKESEGYAYVGSYPDGYWSYNGSPVSGDDDLPFKDPNTGETVNPRSLAPITQADKDAINGAAEGGADPYGEDVIGHDPILNGIGQATGISAREVNPYSTAVGSALDTTDADADAAKLDPTITALQNQQATGDGAWQKALSDATGQSENAASSLGQSQAGVGYSTALRNIGNARAAADQQGAGQATSLRAQSQNDATNQLDNIENNNASADAGQSQAQQGAAAGVSQLNAHLLQGGKDAGGKLISAIGSGIMAVASDGGRVPGKPKVFGDDEANDTVPAMLSPGEIVIPRSHATSPEAAAHFVRALQAKKQIHHFDDGGAVPPPSGGAVPLPDGGPDAANSLDRHINGQMNPSIDGTGNPFDQYGLGYHDIGESFNPLTGEQAASIQNGGLLDTKKYDASRKAVLANADNYTGQFQKNQQNVLNQQTQNTLDSNLAAGMIGHRGTTPSILGAVKSQQGAAGLNASGAESANMQATSNFANAINAQRARDQQMALAKQKALFARTEINAGVSAANQGAIGNILSAGGAGFAHVAGALKKGYGGDDSGEDESGEDESGEDSSGDDTGSNDNSDYGDARAFGGVIKDNRARDFVAALKKAKRA